MLMRLQAAVEEQRCWRGGSPAHTDANRSRYSTMVLPASISLLPDGEWSFRVVESCDGVDGPGNGTCAGF